MIDSEKPLYRDFATYLREHFTSKVQKISINAGFTCPNRDGTVGRGGCTYCNNQTFNPGYCKPSESVTRQIELGKAFFAAKYPSMKYLAYFQAYTSTHGEFRRLRALYEEAMAVDGVEGLVIGTRPDCMPDYLLDYFAALKADNKFILIEYGAETSHDRTLQLINRCHTWSATADAVTRTAQRGIDCGLHLINGLPGESESDIFETIDRVNLLPVKTVKFHQLQLIKGTQMAHDVSEGRYGISRWSADEYIALCCEITRRLRRDIAIERFVSQSPDELLLWPRWGLKNYQFTARLHKALANYPQ